jgi:hypothetical protein
LNRNERQSLPPIVPAQAGTHTVVAAIVLALLFLPVLMFEHALNRNERQSLPPVVPAQAGTHTVVAVIVLLLFFLPVLMLSMH